MLMFSLCSLAPAEVKASLRDVPLGWLRAEDSPVGCGHVQYGVHLAAWLEVMDEVKHELPVGEQVTGTLERL
jgi:hypothetical protein